MSTKEKQLAKPELFFGLVAAIGTDLKLVAEMLEEALTDAKYRCEHIKLGELLESENSKDAYNRYLSRMAAGTTLRKDLNRGDAVVLMGVGDVWARRRQFNASGSSTEEAPAVVPSTAYIFNQLKHPDEVETLRKTYGDSFFF